MAARERRCPECGARVRVARAAFDYTELAGLDPRDYRIVLDAARVRRCECGEAPEIPAAVALHLALALFLLRAATALKPSAYRFLRKQLGWKQADFARHVGITPEHLSTIENGHNRPSAAQELVVRLKALVLLLRDEDVRSAKARRRDPRDLVAMLEDLTRTTEPQRGAMRLRAIHGRVWVIEAAAAGRRAA